MASLPNSAAIARKRDVISSRASSQEMRCQICAFVGIAAFGCPGPLGPTLRIGYSTRSGEYTRSRYFATLAHKNPRVTGWSGSPWIFVARPSCTVIKTPQASGQSCGHTAFTTCFIAFNYRGRRAICVGQRQKSQPQRKRSRTKQTLFFVHSCPLRGSSCSVRKQKNGRPEGRPVKEIWINVIAADLPRIRHKPPERRSNL